MNVNKSQNWNCYACRGFRYIARHYKNKETSMNRRIEQVKDSSSNNLNRDGGLVSPD